MSLTCLCCCFWPHRETIRMDGMTLHHTPGTDSPRNGRALNLITSASLMMQGKPLGWLKGLATVLLCVGASDAFLFQTMPACGKRSAARCSALRMLGQGDFDPLGINKPTQPAGGPPPEMQKLNPIQEKMIKDILEKSKGSTKTKRVEFKSNAKTTAKVNDTDVQSNATLNDYMTLPADEWITLDDEFIERLPVGNGINEVGYRFTVPLKAMMQVDLTATCDVFVNIDASKRQLRFEAKGARLVTGDEDEDDGKIVQVVGPNGTFVPQKLPANFSKSIQASDMRVSFVTLVDWVEKGDGGMWGKGATESKIDMKTDVNVGLTFPPPLSFLPGFMLRQAGGLILKAASAALLPRFAQLVAEDYRRWSRGEPRVGGSLLAPPSDALMKQMYGASGADAPVYSPPQSGVGADKTDNWPVPPS